LPYVPCRISDIAGLNALSLLRLAAADAVVSALAELSSALLAVDCAFVAAASALPALDSASDRRF
jgi:hypothetical protein